MRVAWRVVLKWCHMVMHVMHVMSQPCQGVGKTQPLGWSQFKDPPDRLHFAGPWLTSIGGTTSQRPEAAEIISEVASRSTFRAEQPERCLFLPSSSILAASMMASTNPFSATARHDLSLRYNCVVCTALHVAVSPISPRGH